MAATGHFPQGLLPISHRVYYRFPTWVKGALWLAAGVLEPADQLEVGVEEEAGGEATRGLVGTIASFGWLREVFILL